VKNKSGFLEYLLEDVLHDVKDVTARAMFGGYGLYKNGVIFGIIVDDELYFKADDKNRGQFKDRHSEPFTYEAKKGKRVAMSYWKVPADILEDPNVLPKWIDASVQASKRAKANKKS
jgi:DNA transformation protein